MKYNIKVIVTILFILLSFGINVIADDEEEELFNEIDFKDIVVESVAEPIKEPSLNARTAIIYDRTANQVIWGKNENEKKSIASTTKIMTSIIIIEKCKLTDIVTVSNRAASIGGSKLKLKNGDKITVNDLLYGLMLRSRK